MGLGVCDLLLLLVGSSVMLARHFSNQLLSYRNKCAAVLHNGGRDFGYKNLPSVTQATLYQGQIRTGQKKKAKRCPFRNTFTVVWPHMAELFPDTFTEPE